MTVKLPKSLFQCFKKDKSGVAAAEFAIITPMVAFAAVMMADIGMAVDEHMELDQAVRTAAEFVMDDVRDKNEIEKLIVAAATGAYNTTPTQEELNLRPMASVTLTCECPEAPGVAVACSGTLCANQLPSSIFYDLTASKTYQASFLPDIPLSAELRVQTR